ncbi:MAG: fibronectin type III domain-containing protein, partial [Bacteroidales bacterium]|nr:fibronectin type III domain-containing protein [Bacteroidales bacterium]
MTDAFGKQWVFNFNLDKPVMITGLDYTSTVDEISLTWDVPLDPSQVRGYNVYRSDTEGGSYGKINPSVIEGFSGYTDAGLDPLTTYYYMVCAVSTSGTKGELTDPPLEAWTTLPYHADWPLMEINVNIYGGRTEGSPMTADFDADGNKEIYFTISAGPDDFDKGGIFGFYHDGEEIFDIDNNPTTYSGFYQYDGAGSSATPAIGDINNDYIFEVITTTHYSEGVDRRKIFAHSTIDNEQPGEPELIWFKGLGGPEVKGAVLSDIDYNGSMEVLVKARWGAPLKVLNSSDGSDYPGWPVDIDAYGFSMPVAADIDNNGNKEIIIGYKTVDDCDAGIYIFYSNGNPYVTGTNGLFYQNGPAQDVYDRMDSPVTIVDINNDGYDEIICVSGRYISGNPEGRIFILNRFGDTIPGWGYDRHVISITDINNGDIIWLPVTSVGNIDNEPELEVVIAAKDKIYIWNHDGTDFIDPIYVPGLEAKFIAPLLADVDDDDDIEIIVASNGSNGGIYCYDIDGERVLGWPLRIKETFSTPCIDDIDNDGKNEIIATAGNEVHVWDTEGDADKIEWGKYRHDRYNSGIYGDFCPKNSTPITITEIMDWTDNRILQSDVIIEQDGKLTIYGNVALPEGAKIIVKPG